MKPFRLLTVERLRSRHLDAMAQELHAAGVTRDAMVTVREQLVAELAGGTGTALGTWTGADLDLANNFRQVLRQEIDDQTIRIAAQDEVLAEARTAWLTARGELHAVQALHERHRVGVRAERARLDQRELDEHAGNRRPSLRDLLPDTETTETGIR
jgi:flagellar export protein FliJ